MQADKISDGAAECPAGFLALPVKGRNMGGDEYGNACPDLSPLRR